MTDPKAIRVEIEFDDGRIIRLAGDDAERWSQAANGQAVFNAVHGLPFPELPWQVFKIEKPEGPTIRASKNYRDEQEDD